MISLYSGTPGSGKSLHLASRLYWWIRAGKPVICVNFDINVDKIKGGRKNKHIYFFDGEELHPDQLISLGQAYAAERGRVKEDSFLIVTGCLIGRSEPSSNMSIYIARCPILGGKVRRSLSCLWVSCSSP